MSYILTLLVVGLAVYGGAHLLNAHQISSTHRKILAWSRDPARMRHLSSCSSIDEWITQLHDAALTDDVRLAMDATIAANLPPVDSLHNDAGRNRVRRLGQMLRHSWSHLLSREAQRRGLIEP